RARRPARAEKPRPSGLRPPRHGRRPLVPRASAQRSRAFGEFATLERMRRSFPRGAACALAAWVSVAGCSHAPPEGARFSVTPAGPSRADAQVGPARFVPDVGAVSTGFLDAMSDG